MAMAIMDMVYDTCMVDGWLTSLQLYELIKKQLIYIIITHSNYYLIIINYYLTHTHYFFYRDFITFIFFNYPRLAEAEGIKHQKRQAHPRPADKHMHRNKKAHDLDMNKPQTDNDTHTGNRRHTRPRQRHTRPRQLDMTGREKRRLR